MCGNVNLKKMLNYKIMYKLNNGLEETIAWYKKILLIYECFIRKKIRIKQYC